MTEINQNPESSSTLFTPPATERSSFPSAAVFGAIAAILVIVGGILFATHTHKAAPAGTILPLDPHANTLRLANIAMSESTSLSGGKSTFIDGHIRNTGAQTITGITVQVFFRNDLNLAPQVETLPLQLIRARQPYIDTQPVSVAPLAPGDDREFRLPLENVNENWNIQIPEVRIVHVTTK